MKHHFLDAHDNPTGNLCSFTAAAAAIAASGAGTAAVTGLSVSALGTGAVLGSAGITGFASAGFLGLGTSAFSFSNLFSFASGISQLAGGFLQGAQLDAQADAENLRAKQELINGQIDIVAQKEQLVIDLATFTANRAGSGVSPRTGSAAAAKRAAIEDQEFQTDITRSGARIRSLSRRSSASNIRSRASGARLSGLSGALATGARQIDRNLGRG